MSLSVEVVYAGPERQAVHRTEVAAGTSVAEVLDEACSTTAFAGLNWRDHAVGVFGAVCDPAERLLEAGDRVEIYRPLVMDAMTARRRRAAEQQGE